MIVELRFDQQRPRTWMRHLLDLLAGPGRTLQVSWISTSAERPAGLDALLDLERMLLRRGQRCGGDPEPALLETSRASYGQADLVIDFTTAPREADCPARLYLRPLFDGRAGEDAALAAILGGDLPVIEIRDEVSGALMWSENRRAKMPAASAARSAPPWRAPERC